VLWNTQKEVSKNHVIRGIECGFNWCWCVDDN